MRNDFSKSCNAIGEAVGCISWINQYAFLWHKLVVRLFERLRDIASYVLHFEKKFFSISRSSPVSVSLLFIRQRWRAVSFLQTSLSLDGGIASFYVKFLRSAYSTFIVTKSGLFLFMLFSSLLPTVLLILFSSALHGGLGEAVSPLPTPFFPPFLRAQNNSPFCLYLSPFSCSVI